MENTIFYLLVGSDEYNSLSEEESSCRRLWSKYPSDVQKEFGYDSPHDVDSDWWPAGICKILPQAFKALTTESSS